MINIEAKYVRRNLGKNNIQTIMEIRKGINKMKYKVRDLFLMLLIIIGTNIILTLILVGINNMMNIYGVGYSKYVTRDNREAYLSILAMSYSIVFLTTSLLGMLSDKEETIYWENVNEYVLVNPKWFNFYTLSTMGFVSLFIETFGLVFRYAPCIWAGFLMGIFSMVCLFYKMTTIYFRRSKYVEQIRRDYINSSDCKEKINYVIEEKKEKLKANTALACEQRKNKIVSENLDFMYVLAYENTEQSRWCERDTFNEMLDMVLGLSPSEACRFINSKLNPFMNKKIFQSFRDDA